MTNIVTTFENISKLIQPVSLYNKSQETYNSELLFDESIFNQIELELSQSIIDINDLLSNEIDYLSPLILFLLEHKPLEIDLNTLTSIQEDSSTTRKIYRPNLCSFKQKKTSFKARAENILKQLYEYFHTNQLKEFLCLKQKNQTIYHNLLENLTPYLLKTTYDKYPIAIENFLHIIKSTQHSMLSDTFDFIFPICLLTLDDPSIDMKLISLYLLDHLYNNCTSTDLLLFNRANVIMHALEQNLHHRNERIVYFECLLAMTYRWLSIIENDVYSGKHLFIRTSQMIERFIRDSLLETNIDYRRSITKFLRYYITRLELFTCRHLNHLVELIDDSIDYPLLRYDSLNLLLTLLQVVKPRVNVRRYDIMKILVRCIFKIVDEEKNNTSIISILKKCLYELRLCTVDDYVEDALKSLIQTPQLDVRFRDFLENFVDFNKEKEL